jgi:hypothetical protein
MKIDSKDFSIPSGFLIIDATHFNTVYMHVYVYVCSYNYFKPMLRGVWLSKYLVHVSTCNPFLTKIKKIFTTNYLFHKYVKNYFQILYILGYYTKMINV